MGDLGLGAAIVLQLQFDHLPSPGSLSLLGLLPSQQIGFFFHSRNAGHGAGLTGRTGRNPTLDSQFLHTMTQITLHYIVNIISSTRKVIYGIWTVDWLQHISNIVVGWVHLDIFTHRQ